MFLTYFVLSGAAPGLCGAVEGHFPPNCPSTALKWYPDGSSFAHRVEGNAPLTSCQCPSVGRKQNHYLNIYSINVDEWKDRENDDILYVPKAGEILYRLQK